MAASGAGTWLRMGPGVWREEWVMALSIERARRGTGSGVERACGGEQGQVFGRTECDHVWGWSILRNGIRCGESGMGLGVQKERGEGGRDMV